MLKGQSFGEEYELSRSKLNFGLMGNTGYTTDLFGKGSLAKRFGMSEGCIPNSFYVFFVFSDIVLSIRVVRVGVAA